MENKNVQEPVLLYFKSLGAWAFKTVASSRNGTPDVVACVPITKAEADKLFETQETIGLFVGVEAKDVDKQAKGRPLQEIQLRRIREAGGIGLAVNTVELVKKAINAFRN